MSGPVDENPLLELLHDMIDSIEPIESRVEALYQFVKAKGIATEKELAPYMEQAANANDVRWRAFRVRAEMLMSEAMNPPQEESVGEAGPGAEGDSGKKPAA
ncbi:MAG TPA: hypothetical protein VGG04_11125 [Candidatus Sulfotelmatobacter sp.]|jgi:uncharacterized protein YcaQ